jgi:hypothetical protein
MLMIGYRDSRATLHVVPAMDHASRNHEHAFDGDENGDAMRIGSFVSVFHGDVRDRSHVIDNNAAPNGVTSVPPGFFACCMLHQRVPQKLYGSPSLALVFRMMSLRCMLWSPTVTGRCFVCSPGKNRCRNQRLSLRLPTIKRSVRLPTSLHLHALSRSREKGSRGLTVLDAPSYIA